MGFTHYWKTTKPVKLNEEQWGNLCDVIIEPSIIITSDGNKDNWLTAQKLLTNLGYFVEIPETI